MGAILVTGAAGFVGSHVAEALLARGEQVLGYDNLDPYYDPRIKQRNLAALLKQPGFSFLQADVRDAPALMDAVRANAVDRIVHLAALAGVRASINRANDYVAVNLGGAVNVLDAARTAEVRHTVIVSTSSVYGATARIPFVEDDPADQPLAPYPATKRAAEVMAYSYVNLFAMPIAVVRLFSVYGPRGRPDMMPYQIADGIAHGKPITLFNGGNMHRDWTYVSDISAGIVGALDTPKGFGLYNLGRGEPVLMADFVRLLEGLIGKPALIHDTPAPASEPPITFADISRARETFGYSPQVPVAEGLERFWMWFKNNVP
jgi:UDP-glucuronate 4-epimerase